MSDTTFLVCWLLGYIGYSIIMNILGVTRDLILELIFRITGKDFND